MKKLIVATATFLILTTATKINADELGPPEWSSSMSILAICSDMAGVATILPENEREDFDVKVETPFFGCTNQQLIALGDLFLGHHGVDPTTVFTSKLGPIVFFAYTNSHYNGEIGDWRISIEERNQGVFEAEPEPSLLKVRDGMRSWFPVDTDNGLLFAHLTNVVHTLRTERNWTNYYEVVRSGVTSASERVSNDSKHDLRELIKYADPAQLLLMKNDPLFPVGLKDLLPK